MSVYKSSNKWYAITILLLLLASAGTVYLLKRKSAAENKIPPVSTTPAADTIPALQAIRRLSDSTRVYLLGDTKVAPHNDYPAHREITLDGDAFFDVSAASSDLIIHTKLFTVTVMGKAALRVMGPSKEEWAEVDVVNGTVIVKKAYASRFDNPDTLHGNQMQMLNRTIDLMEKEEFDAGTLKAWSDKLPR